MRKYTETTKASQFVVTCVQKRDGIQLECFKGVSLRSEVTEDELDVR